MRKSREEQHSSNTINRVAVPEVKREKEMARSYRLRRAEELELTTSDIENPRRYFNKSAGAATISGDTTICKLFVPRQPV